jgi:hypothetical protein
VIVKTIEAGLVQTVILSQFGVEPLTHFEILALVGVKERFVKKEIVLIIAYQLVVSSQHGAGSHG